MSEDFKLFIAACITCGRAKQPSAYLKAPLKHLMFHSFNDALCIDHIVPSATASTPRGNRNILTLTDMWSGYTMAIPTKTQTADENIRAIMHNWILKFGMPKEIISDNAPGYGAIFFNAVLKAFGCKPTKGTPYIARSTGKVERSNKRVNQALRTSLTNDQTKNWDLYLNYVCFTLNSLKSRHTGYSANKLVFGRELNTPLSILIENEDDKDDMINSNSYNQRAYELHQTIKSIVRKVRKNAEIDFMHSAKSYNKNLHGPYFKVGDYSYILIPCPQHKHSIRWRGPFPVIKAINDHLYVIKLYDGSEKVTYISKMKHYRYSKFSPRLNPNSAKYGVEKQHIVDNKTPITSDDDSDDSDDDDEVVRHRCKKRKKKVTIFQRSWDQ